MSTPRDRDLTMFTIYDRLGEMDVTGATRAIPGRSVMIDQAAFMQVVHHVGLVAAAILEVLSGLATIGPDGTIAATISRDELADLLSAKEGGGQHYGFRKDTLTKYLNTLQTAGYLSRIQPTTANNFTSNKFILRRSLVLLNGGQSASASTVVGTPQTPVDPGAEDLDTERVPGVEIFDTESIDAGRVGGEIFGTEDLSPLGAEDLDTEVMRAESRFSAGRVGGGIFGTDDAATMVDGVVSSSPEPISTTTNHQQAQWAAVEGAAREIGFQGSLAFLHSFDPTTVRLWIEAIRRDPSIHKKGAYLRGVLREGSTPPDAPFAPEPLRPDASQPTERSEPVAVDDPRVGAAPWDGGVVLRDVQIRGLLDDHNDEGDEMASTIREARDKAVAELGVDPFGEEAREIYRAVATQALVEAGWVGSGSDKRGRRLVLDESGPSRERMSSAELGW